MKDIEAGLRFPGLAVSGGSKAANKAMKFASLASLDPSRLHKFGPLRYFAKKYSAAAGCLSQRQAYRKIQ